MYCIFYVKQLIMDIMDPKDYPDVMKEYMDKMKQTKRLNYQMGRIDLIFGRSDMLNHRIFIDYDKNLLQFN